MGSQNDFSGNRLKIDKEFVRQGKSFRILSCYLRNKELVIDLGIQIPVDKIRQYVEKWNLNPECDDCRNFTAEQLEQMDLDSPFALEYRFSAEVNGTVIENSQIRGICWNPLFSDMYGEDASVMDIMNHYELEQTSGWNLCRLSFQWEKAAEHLSSLYLKAESRPRVLSGPHFTVCGSQDIFSFEHPMTGEIYRLSIDSFEPGILKDGPEIWNGMELPCHYIEIGYHIEPEMPEDEYRLADCCESDSPKQIEKNRYHKRKTSVSIISGQDGPTAVFIAGKKESDKQAGRKVCSSLHFDRVDTVELRLSFFTHTGLIFTEKLL